MGGEVIAVFRVWMIRAGQCLLVLFVFCNVFLFATSKWNSDHMPGLGQWRILSVMTGSMSPAIDAGDMVVVAKYQEAPPQIGDIVTYWQDSRSLVTHRIVQRLENGYMQTKGDANHEADGGWTDPAHLVGKVVFTLPYAATVQRFLQHPSVLMGLVAALAYTSYRKGRRPIQDTSRQTATVEGDI
jgi:signal peptidase